MNPALVVRLRPTGPWRPGPDSGARNRVDAVYHSDTLYAAVTSAMAALGRLEDWLAATAAAPAAPAVRFSSCFPFLEEIDFIVPPRTLWPPAGAVSPRVRWKSARFVPVSLIAPLAAGKTPSQDQWSVDGMSECLLPAGRPGPFRTHVRWNAAVDRLTGAGERHSTACLEFRPGAGLWAVAAFTDSGQRERWSGPLRAALRLLADSGFGGERSRGWGRSEEPEFTEGTLPEMILPGEPDAEPSAEPRPHWLLSLFAPAADDAVDWTRGDYATVVRAGRVGSPAAFGLLKKQLNMVCEGSVLLAGESLRGAAPDVAPDGLPHPVYRAGFALAIPLPRRERVPRPAPPPPVSAPQPEAEEAAPAAGAEPPAEAAALPAPEPESGAASEAPAAPPAAPAEAAEPPAPEQESAAASAAPAAPPAAPSAPEPESGAAPEAPAAPPAAPVKAAEPPAPEPESGAAPEAPAAPPEAPAEAAEPPAPEPESSTAPEAPAAPPETPAEAGEPPAPEPESSAAPEAPAAPPETPAEAGEPSAPEPESSAVPAAPAASPATPAEAGEPPAPEPESQAAAPPEAPAEEPPSSAPAPDPSAAEAGAEPDPGDDVKPGGPTGEVTS